MFLEDQNQKYFLGSEQELIELPTAAHIGRQCGPPNLGSHDSRSPDLPVKSRSCEVAFRHYSSFCDSGCGLAAQDVLNHERAAIWQQDAME